MPGVRKGVVRDLPRGRLPPGQYLALARQLRAEGYGTALIMLRTWKAALAPFLAGIPERVGFVGEARFFLINDLRWGERRLPRMIDRCAALALPADAPLPDAWPEPALVVPAAETAGWKAQHQIGPDGPVVAMAPGAVGPGKRWPTAGFAELARKLTAQGVAVWVVGSPAETPLAEEIAAAGPRVRDFTGPDLRNAILALKAADAAVTNDSGLMHIAAALGTPTVALFGPTDPRLWAPLNPLAATLEPAGHADIGHRRIEDVSTNSVFAAVRTIVSA
jgi:heptosyltransferase-2